LTDLLAESQLRLEELERENAEFKHRCAIQETKIGEQELH